MLARNAQGLYWIGRYLERAEHLCRLLADQARALEDRPVEEIDRNWRRLYGALGRGPLGGALESNRGEEGFMLADAYTLADDLTFEPNNSDSIRECVAAARENARQVRNAIGGEMWSCLNATWLALRDARIQTVWSAGPGDFYRATEDSIRTFSGIAEDSMYRDHGWHFLRLGRFVERAQHVAALVRAHLAVFPTAGPHVESDWSSLLAICEARAAYRRLHSLTFAPRDVVDFLVSDPRLSHSIRYALARIAAALDAVADVRTRPPTAGPQTGLRRRVGRMAARIDYDWPERAPDDDAATASVLGEIGDSCRRLHADIAMTFFDYAIEDAPEP